MRASNIFKVEGDCDIGNDCISTKDYNVFENYPRNSDCTVTILRAALLKPDTREWGMERKYDPLTVAGTVVSKKGDLPKKIKAGQTITFTSDSAFQDVGWKICGTEDVENDFIPAIPTEDTSDCVYPVLLSGALCASRILLRKGSVTTKQCHQLAMDNSACYKKEDNKGTFMYNHGEGNMCYCPTKNCAWKQYVSGYFIYQAVCGDRSWMTHQYTDRGVGECYRTKAHSFRGDNARYDNMRGISEEDCRVSCDVSQYCAGYGYSIGECRVYNDAIPIIGGGREIYSGYHCHTKDGFVPDPNDLKPRVMHDTEGNIIGMHYKGSEAQGSIAFAIETVKSVSAAESALYCLAAIGVLAATVQTYNACRKRATYDAIEEPQEI